jgi:tRNA pseudouridine38-40 synthase
VRRIALLVAYDGTDFAGWQVQRNERTVQAEVQRSIAEVCPAPARVVASGRTDAGVHAAGQVCHFDTDERGPEGSSFFLALNRHLPKDVRILRSAEVNGRFHARYWAQKREYRYYLLKGRAADPFQRPYCCLRSALPRPEQLNRYASLFAGRHDFTSFAAEKDENESKIRTILSAAFFLDGPYTVFRVVGHSFLWKMVRTMVGTVLDLAEHEAEAVELRRIMEGRDRRLAGGTAPARGLFLHRVDYDERPFS